ncbi:MAG: hypothetical protein V2A72_07280 [Candidatus Omnitrophota bacterium]
MKTAKTIFVKAVSLCTAILFLATNSSIALAHDFASASALRAQSLSQTAASKALIEDFTLAPPGAEVNIVKGIPLDDGSLESIINRALGKSGFIKDKDIVVEIGSDKYIGAEDRINIAVLLLPQGKDEYNEKNDTEKFAFRVHKDFVNNYSDILKNDVVLTVKFGDGTTRNLSVARGLAYFMAMHELNWQGKKGGHLALKAQDGAEFKIKYQITVSDHAQVGQTGARYSLINSAILLWYNLLYASTREVLRQDNKKAELVIEEFFNHINDKDSFSDQEHRLTLIGQCVPNLIGNKELQKQVKEIILLINAEFFEITETNKTINIRKSPYANDNAPTDENTFKKLDLAAKGIEKKEIIKTIFLNDKKQAIIITKQKNRSFTLYILGPYLHNSYPMLHRSYGYLKDSLQITNNYAAWQEKNTLDPDAASKLKIFDLNASLELDELTFENIKAEDWKLTNSDRLVVRGGNGQISIYNLKAKKPNKPIAININANSKFWLTPDSLHVVAEADPPYVAFNNIVTIVNVLTGEKVIEGISTACGEKISKNSQFFAAKPSPWCVELYDLLSDTPDKPIKVYNLQLSLNSKADPIVSDFGFSNDSREFSIKIGKRKDTLALPVCPKYLTVKMLLQLKEYSLRAEDFPIIDLSRKIKTNNAGYKVAFSNSSWAYVFDPQDNLIMRKKVYKNTCLLPAEGNNIAFLTPTIGDNCNLLLYNLKNLKKSVFKIKLTGLYDFEQTFDDRYIAFEKRGTVSVLDLHKEGDSVKYPIVTFEKANNFYFSPKANYLGLRSTYPQWTQTSTTIYNLRDNTRVVIPKNLQIIHYNPYDKEERYIWAEYGGTPNKLVYDLKGDKPYEPIFAASAINCAFKSKDTFSCEINGKVEKINLSTLTNKHQEVPSSESREVQYTNGNADTDKENAVFKKLESFGIKTDDIIDGLLTKSNRLIVRDKDMMLTVYNIDSTDPAEPVMTGINANEGYRVTPDGAHLVADREFVDAKGNALSLTDIINLYTEKIKIKDIDTACGVEISNNYRFVLAINNEFSAEIYDLWDKKPNEPIATYQIPEGDRENNEIKDCAFAPDSRSLTIKTTRGEENLSLSVTPKNVTAKMLSLLGEHNVFVKDIILTDKDGNDIVNEEGYRVVLVTHTFWGYKAFVFNPQEELILNKPIGRDDYIMPLEGNNIALVFMGITTITISLYNLKQPNKPISKMKIEHHSGYEKSSNNRYLAVWLDSKDPKKRRVILLDLSDKTHAEKPIKVFQGATCFGFSPEAEYLWAFIPEKDGVARGVTVIYDTELKSEVAQIQGKSKNIIFNKHNKRYFAIAYEIDYNLDYNHIGCRVYDMKSPNPSEPIFTHDTECFSFESKNTLTYVYNRQRTDVDLTKLNNTSASNQSHYANGNADTDKGEGNLPLSFGRRLQIILDKHKKEKLSSEVSSDEKYLIILNKDNTASVYRIADPDNPIKENLDATRGISFINNDTQVQAVDASGETTIIDLIGNAEVGTQPNYANGNALNDAKEQMFDKMPACVFIQDFKGIPKANINLAVSKNNKTIVLYTKKGILHPIIVYDSDYKVIKRITYSESGCVNGSISNLKISDDGSFIVWTNGANRLKFDKPLRVCDLRNPGQEPVSLGIAYGNDVCYWLTPKNQLIVFRSSEKPPLMATHFDLYHLDKNPGNPVKSKIPIPSHTAYDPDKLKVTILAGKTSDGVEMPLRILDINTGEVTEAPQKGYVHYASGNPKTDEDEPLPGGKDSENKLKEALSQAMNISAKLKPETPIDIMRALKDMRFDFKNQIVITMPDTYALLNPGLKEFAESVKGLKLENSQTSLFRFVVAVDSALPKDIMPKDFKDALTEERIIDKKIDIIDRMNIPNLFTTRLEGVSQIEKPAEASQKLYDLMVAAHFYETEKSVSERSLLLMFLNPMPADKIDETTKNTLSKLANAKQVRFFIPTVREEGQLFNVHDLFGNLPISVGSIETDLRAGIQFLPLPAIEADKVKDTEEFKRLMEEAIKWA